jgi:transposase
MPRAKISTVDKERILAAHQNGHDYVEAARILNINRKSAWGIVSRALKRNGVAVVPRGGHRFAKVDEEMKDTACEIVSEHAAWTLKQINNELRLRLPFKPSVSSTSLAKVLDSRLITMKKLEDIPGERNSLQTKEKRKEFAIWMLNTGVHRELVYIVST